MKKRIGWIGAALIVAIVLIVGFGGTEKPEIVCFTARSQTVLNTVDCDGKVEESGQMQITLGKTVIPEKINVKKGDRVWKGRALMEYIEPSLLDNISGADEDTLEAFKALQGSGLMEEYAKGLSADEDTLDALAPQSTKTLTSPTSGIVTEIIAQPNTKSGANDTVMILATSNRLQVKLEVPETKIAEIATGQKVTVSGVGFKNSTYYGVVTEIGSRAKTASVSADGTASVTVYVTILERGSDIKPGYSAKAKILTSEKTNTIVVPYEAVGADNNGDEYVYVVKNDIAKKTYIQTASELQGGFEVVEGLNDGDQIVCISSSVSNGKRVLPVSDTERKIEGSEND